MWKGERIRSRRSRRRRRRGGKGGRGGGEGKWLSSSLIFFSEKYRLDAYVEVTMTGKDCMNKNKRLEGTYIHLNLEPDVCERECQKMKSEYSSLRSLNFITKATSKHFKEGTDNFRIVF